MNCRKCSKPLTNKHLKSRHRLLIDDCTVKENVERLMGGEKAEMVFTSPPYNAGDLDFNRNIPGKGKYLNNPDLIENYSGFLDSFLETWIDKADYVWVNLQFLSRIKTDTIEWLYKWRNNISDWAVWIKENPPPSANDGIMTHGFECIYVFSQKPNGRVVGEFPKGSLANTYSSAVNSNREFSGVHHAGFPIAFVENWISSGKSVADPFMGTGSTLIACEKTNRRCFGMEIDPHYGQVIIERFEKFSGKTAHREDGKTLAELKVS